jgi:peptide deformylase
VASSQPLPLRLYGDPVLRKKAEAVAAVTDEVRALIDSMFATMYVEEGVGLAAPQVGRSLRLFVVDVEEDDRPRVKMAFVNPRIVEQSGEIIGEEGCLSIPGIRADVKRFDRVVVEALDADGNPFRLEADGLLSRALQHENDHLDGILFLDRLGVITRRLLEAKWKRVRPDGDPASGAPERGDAPDSARSR